MQWQTGSLPESVLANSKRDSDEQISDKFESIYKNVHVGYFVQSQYVELWKMTNRWNHDKILWKYLTSSLEWQWLLTNHGKYSAVPVFCDAHGSAQWNFALWWTVLL